MTGKLKAGLASVERQKLCALDPTRRICGAQEGWLAAVALINAVDGFGEPLAMYPPNGAFGGCLRQVLSHTAPALMRSARRSALPRSEVWTFRNQPHETV